MPPGYLWGRRFQSMGKATYHTRDHETQSISKGGTRHEMVERSRCTTAGSLTYGQGRKLECAHLKIEKSAGYWAVWIRSSGHALHFLRFALYHVGLGMLGTVSSCIAHFRIRMTR